MNEGCFTSRQIVSYKGWHETHDSTPAKKRCNLFRGVCLILGAFVEMIGDNTSCAIYEIVSAKSTLQKQPSSSPDNPNPVRVLFQGSPEKFQINSPQLRSKKNKPSACVSKS
jgi:hypothetical protein